MYLYDQFYLLKPDHVPRPEKEDISISGNSPDGDTEEEAGQLGAATAEEGKKEN